MKNGNSEICIYDGKDDDGLISFCQRCIKYPQTEYKLILINDNPLIKPKNRLIAIARQINDILKLPQNVKIYYYTKNGKIEEIRENTTKRQRN